MVVIRNVRGVLKEHVINAAAMTLLYTPSSRLLELSVLNIPEQVLLLQLVC